LAGIRAGMPILVVGILMTVATSYLQSPAWIVAVMFATTVSFALVKSAWAGWLRWSEGSHAAGLCPRCKAPQPDAGAGSRQGFCIRCGVWADSVAR